MSEQDKTVRAELVRLAEQMDSDELNRVLGFALGVTANKPRPGLMAQRETEA